MIEHDDKFSLQNSAEAYPDAGFDPSEDHFVVLLQGQPVGAIYRIADEWIWAIDVSLMGMNSGRASNRRSARGAFRAAWDNGVERFGAESVARALNSAVRP